MIWSIHLQNMRSVDGMDMAVLVFAAVLMAGLGAVYIVGRERNKKKVLAFKAAATLVADVLAVIAAYQEETVAAGCIAGGIFLYACADVLLEIKFIWGIFCFGIGHLWVIAGIGMEDISGITVVVVFGMLYGLALYIFRSYLAKLKQLKIPGLVYAALLCLMSASAFGAAVACGTGWSWARAAGSLCFVISDGIIAWNFVRRSRTRLSGTVLMILYYTAVYLIGAAGLGVV